MDECFMFLRTVEPSMQRDLIRDLGPMMRISFVAVEFKVTCMQDFIPVR